MNAERFPRIAITRSRPAVHCVSRKDPTVKLSPAHDDLHCLKHRPQQVVLGCTHRPTTIATGLFVGLVHSGSSCESFYFAGEANANVDFAYGFIPFGETEIMIDADGQKFLIARSEE